LSYHIPAHEHNNAFHTPPDTRITTPRQSIAQAKDPSDRFEGLTPDLGAPLDVCVEMTPPPPLPDPAASSSTTFKHDIYAFGSDPDPDPDPDPEV
jgi:hypothetical protein